MKTMMLTMVLVMMAMGTGCGGAEDESRSTPAVDAGSEGDAPYALCEYEPGPDCVVKIDHGSPFACCPLK